MENELYQDPENLILHGDYEDFIGSYSGIFDTEWCQRIMQEFDYYQSIGSVYPTQNDYDLTCAQRFDYVVDLSHMTKMRLETQIMAELNGRIWKCFEEYQSVFGTMKEKTYYSMSQKVQKTPKGGGYHTWHCENSGLNSDGNRAAVWMLCLNDDYEGGETEFLYYKKRLNPERGRLLIWPAGYTHSYKENLVLEGMKYVVTGWFHYAG